MWVLLGLGCRFICLLGVGHFVWYLLLCSGFLGGGWGCGLRCR